MTCPFRVRSDKETTAVVAASAIAVHKQASKAVVRLPEQAVNLPFTYVLLGQPACVCILLRLQQVSIDRCLYACAHDAQCAKLIALLCMPSTVR
jgi:hypothetical protein